MQLALNDSDKYAFVIEGASIISHIICRQAVFEDIYLQHENTAASRALRHVLVDLYADIMRYLANIKQYHDSKRLRRVVASGLLGKSDLEEQMMSIRKKEETLYRFTSIMDAETQRGVNSKLVLLLDEINKPLERMSEDLKLLRDGYDEDMRRDILEWISSEPYAQHHQQMKKGLVSGTGQWLLTDDLYLHWVEDSTSSILWLHGIPGSGKSKLASIIIDDVTTRQRDAGNSAAAFFYCSRTPTEPERSNPEVILASIVRQLAWVKNDSPLLPPVVRMFETRKAFGYNFSRLTIDESSELIVELAEYYPVTTIVLDALDECDPATRSDLFDALEKILKMSPELVKVFATSRDDQDITWSLSNYPNIRVSSSKNSADILTFVEAEVESLVKKGKLLRYSQSKETMRALIIDGIQSQAHGM